MGGLLEGDVAVVTGAGSGIGRAIACGFAAAGARVIAADIDAPGAAETEAMIVKAGGAAESFRLDVRDRAACAGLAETVGPITVLVNNAGVVRRAEMSAATAAEDWDAVLSVNLTGMFNVTLAFLDALKAAPGRIVNIGSIQSYVHTPNSVAYTTSKGGVLNFTKGLAAELGPHGVRVNAIGPGLIRTPLNAAARAAGGMEENFLRHTPLGRAGEADDIVGPALFLASDMSRYVTGTLLPVDGGYLTV